MVNLIISIIFWCMPDKDKLGIAAMIVSALAATTSLIAYGWLGIIDVIILIVNIYIYNSITIKDKK